MPYARAMTVLICFLGVTAAAEPPQLRLALGMYSSKRAWTVGDLLTVVVDEQTSSSKTSALATKRESAATASPNNTIGYPASQTNATYQALTNSKGVVLPPYSLSANAQFTGSGNSASAETLQATYTAQVVDVLPNSVLVIRGERSVTFNRENVRMVLTGMVRPLDVTADNTVKSSQIAQATISYQSKGSVTRGSSPGWFWRLFEAINPF
jgi:flagellar L-ring protein precursor FlgH